MGSGVCRSVARKVNSGVELRATATEEGVTGGSETRAVEVLIESGFPQDEQA